MVPNLKNQDRVLAPRPDQAPATLRDVLDLDPDPRRQAARRRLETILGAPLESLSADIDWVDAQFPRTDIDRLVARYADFHKASSEPKSD